MSGADVDQTRWSSPQGNVTGLGIVASYSLRFWTLVIGLGLLAGISAGLLILLLRFVERVTYGGHGYSVVRMATADPGWQRLLALLGAACIVVGGLAWLGRLRPAGATEVSDGLWVHAGKLALVPSLARGIISIVTVGMGVSLGREGAPQLFGAVMASRASDRMGLPLWQRRLLVAAGAGAGFSAVYNVPLGGTLFALEVLLGTIALPLVLPALLMSLTATAIAWIILGNQPLYHVGAVHFHLSQLVFAVVMGPIIGVVATGWTRVIGLVARHRPRGRWRYIAPFLAFAVLGLLSMRYPQLLGNGRGIVQLAIIGNLSVGLLVVLLLLKPLVTSLCLGTGAPGGLFTPSFAVGVLLAGTAGAVWGDVWPGSLPGAYALIGGGAFLAAAMQGPLSGVVLVIELTGHLDALVVPTLLAVVIATVVSRRLGAASIYSARVDTGALSRDRPAGDAASVAAIDELDHRAVGLDPPDPPPDRS
ncbi:MAG TPA: chloride channel protein [Solirubrobacteraceae bacterium]|nr:chloride channel protein [Solirubrobacteraceae bacterium]